MKLRHYQENGVAFLRANQSALLADEMGLGKTIQAISAIRELAESGGVGRVLIIAPTALQANWRSEIKIWAPDIPFMQIAGDQEDRLASYNLPVLIQLASYDQIRLDCVKMPTAVLFDLMVLDEAQRIKNPNSMTALSCRLVRRQRSWALTGTPFKNQLSDIGGVFRFVKQDLLGNKPIDAELTQSIKPYVLRRRLRDVVPELPALIDQTTLLDLPPIQRRVYEELEYDAATMARNENTKTSTLLALITKLKQICNYDEKSGTSVKLDALQSILNECSSMGKKVLVFSQYVGTLRWLVKRLSVKARVFHGGLSSTEKDSLLESFKISPFAETLLMSIKAGGVGLNLQEASVIVLFDRWWNPATESQAIARAHRIGQKEPVLVYRFLVRNSVEERIQSLIESKVILFEEHVNSLAAKPTPNLTALRTVLLSH